MENINSENTCSRTFTMTKVPLILGTMTFGIAGKSGVRTSDTKECQKLVDAFLAHGHSEIDTSRMYGDGTTEEVLSKINIQKAALDTKVFPSKPGDHAPHNLRRVFQGSLHILRPHKIRVLYLHRPDRTVPFEETCAAIDEMHKEGLFEIFGLSNYAAWEVAEIVGICKMNGYIMPKIYQAMYNPITRAIEPELVPCLRKFDIRLVIYNPLAGGLFSGKITSVSTEVEKGSRFDKDTDQGALYRERYLKDGYFKALKSLKDVSQRTGIKLTEMALRWCQHHSVLQPGDGIIIGASNLQQLESNLSDSAKGPLPKEVLDALDDAWRLVGSDCPPYWR